MTGLSRERMLEVVQRYMDGRNRADADAIASCLAMPPPIIVRPECMEVLGTTPMSIARNWLDSVARLGSYWTVDRLVCDVEEAQAVCEWTH
jgi:hypothetical protein